MDTAQSSESIPVWENQAQELARQSKWRAAARTLLRAARAEPLNTDRWLQIAQWQRRDRDNKAAARTLRTALRLSGDADASIAANGPHTCAIWQALAEVHLEAQAWAECITACSVVLEREPRNHFTLEMQATAYLYYGDPASAAKVMRTLLRLSPRDPLHRLKLATLLHLQGELGESVMEFQRVVQCYPEAAFTQEATEAIEALDRIQIQQILARLAEQKDFSDALHHNLETALKQNGFFLSDAGIESLRHLIADGRPDVPYSAPVVH